MTLIQELGFAASQDILLEKLNYYLTSHSDKLWVAKHQGDIIGLIAINILNPFYSAQRFARVDSIVVAERYRTLGIGKYLMRVAEEYAKSVGCGRVFLTSGNHRDGAHQFYKLLHYKSNATYFVKYL